MRHDRMVELPPSCPSNMSRRCRYCCSRQHVHLGSQPHRDLCTSRSAVSAGELGFLCGLCVGFSRCDYTVKLHACSELREQTRSAWTTPALRTAQTRLRFDFFSDAMPRIARRIRSLSLRLCAFAPK